ncbi:MAG: DMT family transporter [Peptococcaceae bacterium]|nr:DMT family transporter [Peptococcaceae bacterium]
MKTGFLSDKYGVALVAIFCSVLWGSAFPVLKVTYQEMAILPGDYGSRIILAAMRFMLAGIALLVLVRFGMKSSFKVERRYWPAVVVSGILQISLQYFFFYNGLANTTGMKGAVLQSCCTFFVVIFAHLFLQNDKLNWKKGFGLVTGFGGIILVNWGQKFNLEFSLAGEGFLILAGIASAAAMIQAKNLTQNINAFALTGWQMVIGSAFLFCAGFLTKGTVVLDLTPLAGGLLIYSAFLSAASFSLWYAILKYNKAGEIEIYRFMIPVSGALLSAFFIPGEDLNIMMIGALFMVAVGIFAVNRSPQ